MRSCYVLCCASVFFFSSGVMSCSKESAVKTNAPATSSSEVSKESDAAVNSISRAIDPSGFLGIYTVRDEKTIYQGQANPRSSNVFIHLSYIDVQKAITSTPDKKHLTMPYGPSNYVDSGWAYIIDYDKATNTIKLSPNKAMQDDIVAGSFETLLATYDPTIKEGTFVTRFTALKDNGNESQVSEGFWKE